MWGGVFFAEKRGWVGEENAFFEFFLREASTAPPPARPIYPRGGDPSPQRTRNGYTAQAAGQTMQSKAHPRTLDTLHRSALDTRQAAPGKSGRRRRWRACISSIMRIVIALSQAWYIDSNMNKYHKDILSFLVIVNYYLSIDISSY